MAFENIYDMQREAHQEFCDLMEDLPKPDYDEKAEERRAEVEERFRHLVEEENARAQSRLQALEDRRSLEAEAVRAQALGKAAAGDFAELARVSVLVQDIGTRFEAAYAGQMAPDAEWAVRVVGALSVVNRLRASESAELLEQAGEDAWRKHEERACCRTLALLDDYLSAEGEGGWKSILQTAIGAIMQTNYPESPVEGMGFFKKLANFGASVVVDATIASDARKLGQTAAMVCFALKMTQRFSERAQDILAAHEAELAEDIERDRKEALAKLDGEREEGLRQLDDVLLEDKEDYERRLREYVEHCYNEAYHSARRWPLNYEQRQWDDELSESEKKWWYCDHVTYGVTDSGVSSQHRLLVEQSVEERWRARWLDKRFHGFYAGDFILLKSSTREQAVHASHEFIGSFLRRMPIGKGVVHVFDPHDRGASISPFLELKNEFPGVFGGDIITSSEDFSRRLDLLDARIDCIIQEKLVDRFDTVFDYNVENEGAAEPVHLLVLYDFPDMLGQRDLQRLKTIVGNGRRCGVFAVLVGSDDAESLADPYLAGDFSGIVGDANVYPICEYESNSSGRFMSISEKREGSNTKCTIRLSPLEPHELLERFRGQLEQAQSAQAAVAAEKLSEAMELVQESSVDGLDIPMGASGTRVMSLRFGQGTSHHGLILGRTGSGKSTLYHTLIINAMRKYSPDELNLYLMDFKRGVEFKVYDRFRLPHLKLLAISAVQEFGENVLMELHREMERRGELFRNEGVNDLASYVKASGKPLPRILVIMDEFQVLFEEGDNRSVAQNCATLTKAITGQGRSFGIHLLMATQTARGFAGLSLSRDAIEQMSVRIGMGLGEDDARYLFGDVRCQAALEAMRGPVGTAALLAGADAEGVDGFRVAYYDDDRRDAELAKIADCYAGFEAKTRVFEEGRPAPLGEYLQTEGIGFDDAVAPNIHLFEMERYNPAFALRLDSRARHNMLVLGGKPSSFGISSVASDFTVADIVDVYLTSALLNRNAQVYLVDGEYLDGDDDRYDACRAFSDAFGGSRFCFAESERDVAAIIRDAHELHKRNKAVGRSEQRTAVLALLEPSRVDALNRLFAGQDLEEPDADSGGVPAPMPAADPGNPFAGFESLFSEPAGETPNANGGGQERVSLAEALKDIVGSRTVHVLLATTDSRFVKEHKSFGGLLRDFDERLAFGVSDESMALVFDDYRSVNLAPDAVCFTPDVNASDGLFKLKPFEPMSPDELRKFVNALPARRV